jgi:GTP-binding protein HflX
LKPRSAISGGGNGGSKRSDRCVVLHPRLGRGGGTRTPEARLDEAVGLAQAIGLDVYLAEVIRVAEVRPATLFGAGSVTRIGARIEGAGSDDGGPIGVVLVDGTLTPVQQRNLEKTWHCKVIDRTGAILEIFGERARTAEGRLQVELAALTYQRSRLVRSWTHLERQRGGFGFLGGPGESQLEADRRLISDRIARLRRELAEVKRTRGLHRRARRRVPFPVVALVGYTNAGKSTLFNRLTSAEVTARDQLFATLDPTMRGFTLPSGQKAILSDTVGFISDLPHELVEAFHATLEEVIEADVLLHVRDASHPESDEQRQDVLTVLDRLGARAPGGQGMFEVLNKIDLLDPAERLALGNRVQRSNGSAALVCARTGEGLDRLLVLLEDRLLAETTLLNISLPRENGRALAWLYDHGSVIAREDGEDAIHVKVRLRPADAARWTERHDLHSP